MNEFTRDSLPKRLAWFLSLVRSSLNQFSKDEEARFRLMTGLKLALLQFASFLILVVCFYYLISLDLLFFESFGLANFKGFQDTFFDFILDKVLELMPIFFGVFIFAFIIGIYLGHLLLRPFRLIGEYCERRADEDTDASYDPDFLTDLKLLTRFSEYFFSLMEHAIENKKLPDYKVPEKFQRIHTPVFENAFFLQYFISVMVIAISFSGLIYVVALDVQYQIVEIALKVLNANPEIKYFLGEQSQIWQSVTMVIIAFYLMISVFLAIHLYEKVSSPAFGFFATMRAFLKGQTTARVHLIGYYYVRPHSRKLNRFLDYVVKNADEEKKV